MKAHPSLANMALTIAIAMFATVAQSEPGDACTGLEASLRQPKGNLPPSVVARIRATAEKMKTLGVPAGTNCTDLGKVLSRLVNGNVVGGKRLEGDEPLDVAAAQAELDQALQQNAELKAQLEALRSAVADEQERMLYEATLFQSNNLYGARDLRLQQFIDRANGG